MRRTASRAARSTPGNARSPARSGASARAAVRPDHPRLLLDHPTLKRLNAIQTGDDARWQALKARADLLATFTVLQYKFDTRTDEPEQLRFAIGRAA